MDEWLNTNAQLDLLMSLRETTRQLDRVPSEMYNWKWALLALSSAVNTALVCNLNGPMGIGALERKLAMQIHKALQPEDGAPHDARQDSLPPHWKLATPKELLDRAQGKKRIERAGHDIFVSATQLEHFEILTELRNQFMHFSPSIWEIELKGLPDIVQSMANIIRAAAQDGQCTRYLTVEEETEFFRLCDDICAQGCRLSGRT